MNDLFKIKTKYRHQDYSESLYFKAKDNGDTITIEDIDYDAIKENFEYNYQNFNDNSLKLSDFDRFYKKEKHLLELHKDFVEYGIELYYKKSNNEYEHLYTAYIGSNKSVTKEELLGILRSDEEVDSSFDLENLKEAQFKAEAFYKKAFSYDNLSVAKLTEHSTEIVEHKKDLEYLIKEYDNKASDNYLIKFMKLYNFDKLGVIEKLAESKYKNLKKYYIPERRNFVLYANDGLKIDTNKIYSNEELAELANNNDVIIVDTSKFDSKAFTFEDSFCGATKAEINNVIKNNIDKEMLVNDYKEFMNYYNLAKIDIKLRLKEIKAENDEKIKDLNEEKRQGDKTLNLLEENYEMKL